MKPRFYWLVVGFTDTVGVHTSLELVSYKVFADMDGSVQMARYLPKEISAKDGEFECEPSCIEGRTFSKTFVFAC